MTVYMRVLHLGFCLIALFGQVKKCDATHTATTALEAITEYWFPRDIEFNESCVAEGCPELKNMSICASDFDINALNKVTKIISNCMTGPICGIVIDPRPLPSLVASTDELLKDFEVNGIVTFAPGTGYLSNTSNIQLDMTSNRNQHLPMQVTMTIPNIRFYGYYPLDFRIETDFGQTLTARLPNSTYDLQIQFFVTLSINYTGPNIDIKLVHPMIIVSPPELCGLELPAGFPNIHTPMITSIKTLYETSTMAKAIGQFMVKLYRGAVQVTTRNCKSLNDQIQNFQN